MSPSNSAKAAELDLTSVATAKRENITALLSMLLTYGANEEIDRICRDNLSIQPSYNAIGVSR
jgi:WD repeat-containing protein 7